MTTSIAPSVARGTQRVLDRCNCTSPVSTFLGSVALAVLAGCSPAGQSSAPVSPEAPAVAVETTPRSTWRAESSPELNALDRGRYVESTASEGSFPLFADGKAAPVFVSAADAPGVQRVAGDLAQDIERVTGVAPSVGAKPTSAVPLAVLVGTLGQSELVDALVAAGKLDASVIAGRWETHLTTLVDKPFDGVDRALVIVGSDPRGSIFGAYELSRQIGVSPWHFWDDVPVRHREALYVKAGRYSQGEPVVKYRGFFINDEEPQLGRWSREYFGLAPNPKYSRTFNHKLYARVYEVLLRLRGNYLWPAVWGRSLFDDDPKNQALAAEYGIVMGTSHEAPMMRAQHEWDRFGSPDGPYGGSGEFSFVRNPATLEKYWADGLRRMGSFESLVTVGMRGNGDTGMEDAAGTELMQHIVTRQRSIIEEVMGKPAAQVPQVWTLYKEVQDYWDAGMRAPDDVTIIWCDDNWGNMRGLPNPAEPMRSGGFGLYYHFDYVGGSRNYKWLDTTLLPSMWEQLHLSYQYGVDRVWMTNVGDLKNNEHPLEFFLDYAWDPERYPMESLHQWEVDFATEQFGPEHAEAIATLLERYENLASLRKPELLNRVISVDPAYDLSRDDQLGDAIVYSDGSPLSLVNYREAELIVERWIDLEAAAEATQKAIPAAYADAYYQLVYYPIVATANVYELRLAQFQNLLYAKQGRGATNARADRAQAHFARDQALSKYYDTELSGGKWLHFQSQAKLGYGGPYPNSSWQQPQGPDGALPDFIWPELQRIEVPERAALAVAIDGSDRLWPGPEQPATLPVFSPYQTQPTQFLEVVNLGKAAFDYRVEADASWLTIAPSSGSVNDQVRVELSVDWAAAPEGRTEVPVRVHGPEQSAVVVTAVVHRPSATPKDLLGFVESNGVVSIEAEHFDRNISRGQVAWTLLPDAGRTGGGMTPFPVTASRQEIAPESPRLEYDFHSFSKGPVTVWAYLSPRNNVLPTDGLKVALSIDDEPPQVVNVTTALNAVPPNRSWERNTADNVTRISTKHAQLAPGGHVLKFWMVDPTVIVQKLIVDAGGLRDSYLGPPESHRVQR